MVLSHSSFSMQKAVFYDVKKLLTSDSILVLYEEKMPLLFTTAACFMRELVWCSGYGTKLEIKRI